MSYFPFTAWGALKDHINSLVLWKTLGSASSVSALSVIPSQACPLSSPFRSYIRQPNGLYCLPEKAGFIIACAVQLLRRCRMVMLQTQPQLEHHGCSVPGQ